VRRRQSATIPAADRNQDVSVEALFRAEYEPMHRLAYTMLGSDADAEEVVQDAFLALATRWASVQNPGGYLRTSVVNGVRKRWRTQSRRAYSEGYESTESEGRFEAATSDPYLLDVVDALPERQRLAVVLTYYADLNSTEVGALIDCEASTVRSLLHRAMQHMAEVVER
jgi:RNA polymerase sigma-70 factor (ECF subfamily)